MKRTVPLLIAATTGFVVIVSYFLPYTQSWGKTTMIWFDILAAIAFVLGGANLLKLNLQKISNRRAGWGYSVVMIAAFLATLIVGFSKFGVHPSESFPDFAWSGAHDQSGSGLWWIYEYMYYPLAATMFSLLAFFIASATFRAFRAKNTEALILLSTAFVVLLGRTYAGIYLTDWLQHIHPSLLALRFDKLTETIMDVFNLAGIRAVTIGIALGIVSTSLKVLLGVDRSYLGSDQD